MRQWGVLPKHAPGCCCCTDCCCCVFAESPAFVVGTSQLQRPTDVAGFTTFCTGSQIITCLTTRSAIALMVQSTTKLVQRQLPKTRSGSLTRPPIQHLTRATMVVSNDRSAEEVQLVNEQLEQRHYEFRSNCNDGDGASHSTSDRVSIDTLCVYGLVAHATFFVDCGSRRCERLSQLGRVARGRRQKLRWSWYVLASCGILLIAESGVTD